ncbi:dienelactone hydrolase family protein [Nocardia ignorata]|uniref:dienelactone hydrolase family protein n=1 Tax=Nocardia ignorata TaxID=145285 RepID=UPI00363CA854
MTVLDAVAASAPGNQEVMIACAELVVNSCLRVPPDPVGVIVFAHGSGTDRHNPRHRYMGELLARHGFASLTVDVLTPAEAGRPDSLFDVELLGDRLIEVRGWLHAVPALRELPTGLLGTGSDAPAALWAAGELGAMVGAVVVRGARPDLAGARLTRITAPTLFLVGGLDRRVLAHNQCAAELMRSEHRLTRLMSPGRSPLDS